MPKRSLKGRILQLKICNICAGLLCIVAVLCFLNYYGTYNYEFVPIDQINNLLVKAVSPNLVLDEKKPLCEYDYKTNKETYYGRELPLDTDKFQPDNIKDGNYTPPHCRPLFSVAILVTYRNRQAQLNLFLPYMHNFLRKQNIHYKIYVIEQQDDKPWNKGSLYNVGARVAATEGFPCLVLYDVDLLPLDAGNLHACLRQPRHLSAAIDKFRFVLPYPSLVGGSLAITTHHYQQINGYSNEFLFWGGEDDNFFERILAHNLNILRLPRELSRYVMLAHAPTPRNPRVWAAVERARTRIDKDGLSTLTYRTITFTNHRLFTLIGVKF